MAEEKKKAEAAAPASEETAKAKPGKKVKPANCAFSNARISRKNWYYRNGLYFASKGAFKEHQTKKLADDAKKAQDAQKAAEAPKEGS